MHVNEDLAKKNLELLPLMVLLLLRTSLKNKMFNNIKSLTI